jgi:hypothetical protein
MSPWSISSGYVDGYARHEIGSLDARKQITFAWSAASAMRGALDLGLLVLRARLVQRGRVRSVKARLGAITLIVVP